MSAGRERGVPLPAIEALAWARVKAPVNPAVLPPVTDLGPGKREVLAIAIERPGSLAILDDGLARRYALHLGIRVLGTLGILLRAKGARLIPAVAPVLDLLDNLGFRVDPTTRLSVLRIAGEQFR